MTLLVVLLFILYFINNKEDFEAVFLIPVNILLALFTLNSLRYFVDGLFILSILKLFNLFISGAESFYISIISSFGNNFLPMQGGAAIRAVYLKKTLKFPYAHFIATLYGNYIIIFGVNAFIALLALMMLQINDAVFPLPLFAFFGFLFISMAMLASIRIDIKLSGNRKLNIIKKFLDLLNKILYGWEMLSADNALLVTLVFITLVSFSVMTIIYSVEFSALGIRSNLTTILLYNCLSGVSLLISLTPGSLGIRESIFYFTSDILGLNSEQIMQLALLDRGVSLLTLFFWFIILSLWKLIIAKTIK